VADCQVDFYLLGPDAQDAGQLACRLALMAWERGHVIDIVTANASAVKALDEMLWQHPPQRFVPHTTDPSGAPAPIRIHQGMPAGDCDVVINLTTTALAEPARCRRLLEIVPHRDAERTASREKFRAYRALGIEPGTHQIN
jgi:DNA polymerase-3 subunit chi